MTVFFELGLEIPMAVTAALSQHAVQYGGEIHRRTQGRRSNYPRVAVTVSANLAYALRTRRRELAGKLPFTLGLERPQRSKAPPVVRFILPKHSCGRDDPVAKRKTIEMASIVK